VEQLSVVTENCAFNFQKEKLRPTTYLAENDVPHTLRIGKDRLPSPYITPAPGLTGLCMVTAKCSLRLDSPANFASSYEEFERVGRN